MTDAIAVWLAGGMLVGTSLADAWMTTITVRRRWGFEVGPLKFLFPDRIWLWWVIVLALAVAGVVFLLLDVNDKIDLGSGLADGLGVWGVIPAAVGTSVHAAGIFTNLLVWRRHKGELQ